METLVFLLGWYSPTSVVHSVRGDFVVPRCPDISLRLTFCAEGQRPQTVSFRFDLEDLNIVKGAPTSQTVKSVPVE